MTIWSDVLALAGVVGLGTIAMVKVLERASYDETGPERIDLARRAAQVTRLIGAGMTQERAIAWCLAWEAEAARRGRERHQATFWRDGGRWIDGQLTRHRRPTSS
jgi:hypothetical protein